MILCNLFLSVQVRFLRLECIGFNFQFIINRLVILIAKNMTETKGSSLTVNLGHNKFNEWSFSDRFKYALGDESPYAFAKRTGLAESLVRKYASGASTPGLDRAAEIADELKYELYWLATGKGPMRKGGAISNTPSGYHVESRSNKAATAVEPSPDPSEYCYLPLYDVYASAEHGTLNDNEQVIDRLAFKQSWLRGEMSLSPENCCLIHVTGDSMAPTLHERDVAMIDRSHTHIIVDGIYCLRLDGGLLIKRLQRLMGNKLKVISDNPVYEAFTIDNFDTKDQGIIGRIIWVGKRF